MKMYLIYEFLNNQSLHIEPLIRQLTGSWQ